MISKLPEKGKIDVFPVTNKEGRKPLVISFRGKETHTLKGISFSFPQGTSRRKGKAACSSAAIPFPAAVTNARTSEVQP